MCVVRVVDVCVYAVWDARFSSYTTAQNTQGLPSASFLLDDRRMRLVPASGQRAYGKSCRGVAQALAAFGEVSDAGRQSETNAREGLHVI